MTERNDHTEAADDAERGADAMEERSERLSGDIEDTRDEWKRKQADESVPGAVGGPQAESGDEDPEEVAIAGSADEDRAPDADAQVGDPDTDESGDRADASSGDDSGDRE